MKHKNGAKRPTLQLKRKKKRSLGERTNNKKKTRCRKNLDLQKKPKLRKTKDF